MCSHGGDIGLDTVGSSSPRSRSQETEGRCVVMVETSVLTLLGPAVRGQGHKRLKVDV